MYGIKKIAMKHYQCFSVTGESQYRLGIDNRFNEVSARLCAPQSDSLSTVLLLPVKHKHNHKMSKLAKYVHLVVSYVKGPVLTEAPAAQIGPTTLMKSMSPKPSHLSR